MNENSPICARLMPTWSEVRVSLPPRKAPAEQVSTLPSTTAMVISRMGCQYSSSIAGWISRPIATKKMALNMSRTGSTSASMR